jgi:hypothetical protein
MSPPAPGTSAGTKAGIGYAIGCKNPPSSATTYGLTGKLQKKIYTGCTNSARATETIRVATGGHAINALEGVDGLNIPAEMYQFFAAYGG